MNRSRVRSSPRFRFLDTDLLIEETHGCTLQQIVDRKGVQFLRDSEEKILAELQADKAVISTGGSAVFSRLAMQNLSSIADVVYLSISVPTMLKRVKNENGRGLVKSPSTSLNALYFQRLPLYQHWADVTIANDLPLSAYQFDRIVDALSECSIFSA